MKLVRPVSVVGAAALALSTLVAPASAADVNRNPIGFLAGPATGLSNPAAVTLDKAGNRYVANGVTASVTVYAPGASGNAAPSRTISGDATTLVGPRSVAVADDGTLYVGDLFGVGTNKVAVFAPGANGNVAPLRVIAGDQTGLAWPSGLALDSAGRLFVANREGDSVTVYIPGASGNASPLRTIAGASTGLDGPSGVALRGDNTVHVVNSGSESVSTFPAGASGNVSPTRTIVGANTGLDSIYGLALDSRNNIYVANSGFGGPGAISVFAPAAQGNVAPLIRLTGANTDLFAVFGVAVDTRHKILATVGAGTSALLTFAPLVPLPPTAVRALKVSGTAGALTRAVTWKAPADNGGARITGYRITVKKGTRTLISKLVRPSRTRFVLERADLRDGKNKVIVVARNKAGLSPRSSVVFRVVK